MPDEAMLWLRWVDGQLACSGMIREGVIARDRLDALLDAIDLNTNNTDHQMDYQVSFVEALMTRGESGEESFRF